MDRIKDFRSGLYANPRFQQICSVLPITRPIAKAKAAAVFDLCAGFVYSQVLYTCVKLDVLSLLQNKALNVGDASKLFGLPPEGTERLFRAAVALDILEERSQFRFGLGPVGAAVLGSPGLQGMIAHHRHLYQDLSRPLDLLNNRSTTTELANYWAYSRASADTPRPPQYVKDYSALMSQTLDMIADEIMRAYPMSRHRRILDVGGGDGAFLAAVGARLKSTDLMLFDLPPVARLASARFTAAGQNIEICGGNMFEDDWPKGADLITLVRVALDHDDEAVLRLYAKARKALKPGATLLIAEPMADVPKVGDAYFGMYLWAMGSGRARTTVEHKRFLRAAGFQKVRTVRTNQPVLVRIVSAA